MTPDRPLRVYDIPPAERAYWDALDDRVKCGDCRLRSDIYCRAGQGRTIYPPTLLHRCDDFERARAR